MTYQSDIVKASTIIATHIARMKDSKYKSVVASGIDFEKFYDKVLELAIKADIANQLYNVTVYFKGQENKLLEENYSKDLKWLTDECLRLGGSMEDILENIYDGAFDMLKNNKNELENNHNKVQESQQGDS